nr:transposase [Pseudomonas fluorescens]
MLGFWRGFASIVRHRRQVVFAETGDFEYYLADLRELKEVFGVRVYAYCLMTNHVHLLLASTALQRGQLTGTSRFVDEVEHITGLRIISRG